MYICSDPLDATQCIDVNAQWSIQLPFCRSPVFPCCLDNVECDNRTPYNITSTLHCDANNYTGSNIFDSSLFGESRLRKRIRQKVESNQIASADVADSTLQRSTDVEKKQVTDFMFAETVDTNRQDQNKDGSLFDRDIEQNELPVPFSESFKSRSPSLIKPFLNENLKSKPLSRHSSIQSIQSSTIDNQTIGSSTPMSPIRDAYPLPISNETNFENVGNKSRKISDQSMDHIIKATSSNQENLLTDNSTLNIDTNHLSTHRVMNTTNPKGKLTNSVMNSPKGSARGIRQQNLPTPLSIPTHLRRSPSVHSQYNNRVLNMSTEKYKKGNNWIDNVNEKLSNKQLNTKSCRDMPSKPMFSRHINNTNKFNVNHLHMREALTALEPHLAKEAIQKLINKKKDSQKNFFMRILTGSSECCRSYRNQRRLATITQHSIDIAIKDIPISIIDSNM